jgi:hypothetical protein
MHYKIAGPREPVASRSWQIAERHDPVIHRQAMECESHGVTRSFFLFRSDRFNDRLGLLGLRHIEIGQPECKRSLGQITRLGSADAFELIV